MASQIINTHYGLVGTPVVVHSNTAVTQDADSKTFTRQARFGITHSWKLDHSRQRTFVNSLCKLAYLVNERRDTMKTSHTVEKECAAWEENINSLI